MTFSALGLGGSRFFVCFVLIATFDQFATAQSSSPQLPRIRAVKGIAETILVGSVEMQLLVTEGDIKVEAAFTSSFSRDRLQFKRSYRTKERNSNIFSNWVGPELVVLSGDETVLYRQKQYPDSTSLKSRIRNGVDQSVRLFWPQFLGTSISGVWAMPEKSPRGFLEQSSFREVSSDRVELNGSNATRIEYSSNDLPNMQVWFLDNCRGMVAKIAISTEASGSQFEYLSEIKPREWEPGIWYPETIVTERRVDGRQVFLEKVDVVSFTAKEPDEKMFGFEGVELELGGIVCDETKGKDNYFRLTESGPQLMSPAAVSEKFSKTPAEPKSVGSMAVYLSLGIFVLIATLGAIVYGISKRSSSR
jgi:hypothetical protein